MKTMPFNTYDVVIIGAGVAGCTAARVLADQGKKVLILEQTETIGGQAADNISSFTNICQLYGIHILYTNSDKLYNFCSRFDVLKECKMTAATRLDGQDISLPMNFYTFDEFFKDYSINIKNELLKHYKFGQQVKFDELLNNKDLDNNIKQQLQYLIERIFIDYSKKQWQQYFEGNQIINRIPIYIGYTKNYYKSKYYCVPSTGFSNMFKNMIKDNNITLKTNVDYKDYLIVKDENIYYKDGNSLTKLTSTLINTTLIDKFFDYKLGKLEYKSLKFVYKENKERFDVNAIHFPNTNQYIRVSDTGTLYGVNKKHSSFKTYEYPEDYVEGQNLPLYTIMTEKNIKLAEEYKNLSNKHTNLIQLGRCAEYKYYTMADLMTKCLELKL